MNNIKKISLFLFIFLLINVFLCDSVDAQEYRCEGGTVIYSSLANCQSSGCTNCIQITNGSSGTSPPVELDNPLGENVTAPELIGKVINAVLGIVGSLALVMFIYGGFIWMTSSGNMEMVAKGKNILIWATVGLVVIFASYAIVHFIIFEGIAPTPPPQ